jgi:hypothetical protein
MGRSLKEAPPAAQPVVGLGPVAEALATTGQFSPAEFQAFFGGVLALRARREKGKGSLLNATKLVHKFSLLNSL